MSYTPPTYNAVDADFTDATYNPPAYNRVRGAFTDAPPELIDSSSGGHYLTLVGNAIVESGQKKFGTSALDLTVVNSNSRVEITDDLADFAFGTGQFTVEAWMRITTASLGWYGIVTQWENFGPGSFWLGLADTGFLGFYNDAAGPEAPYTPPLNTWVHVAADRDASNVIRLYADGVVIDSRTSGAALSSSALPFNIGNDSSGGRRFPGQIDGVHVSRVARYGGAFTPPSSAPVADANSVLVANFDMVLPVGGAGGHRRPRQWQRGSVRGNSFKKP